jgi:hypothetical protein
VARGFLKVEMVVLLGDFPDALADI